MNFVHLNLHTDYSVTDSTIRIASGLKQSLIDTTRKHQQTAVAITDNMNLSGLVGFYQQARRHGIKPIVAADVWVQTPFGRICLALYVTANEGYQQLCRILTRGWCHLPENNQPTVDFDFLSNNCSGLIALCGGVNGCIAPQALRRFDLIDEVLKPWLEAFGDRFYLEIHRFGLGPEEAWIERAVELSQGYQIPLVATNKVRFIDPTDWQAHKIRVCINQSLMIDSEEIKAQYSPHQYFRSTTEMQQLFADLPSAIENTELLAQRCHCELQLDVPQLPQFAVPSGQSVQDYFSERCQQGLQQRLLQRGLNDHQQLYQKRLQTELEVIINMHYMGYFLIVADFIQWSKNQRIPVGPGRGSGAGSLVAYSLLITDVDPLQFGLIFERFLNPERHSMPDVDIDFCMDRRDEVIQYVVQRYGLNQVAQIMTFGRLSPRSVVRDVARVLGLPYGVGDQISKQIPRMAASLDEALEESTELCQLLQTDDESREVIRCAKEVEGLVRQVGKHAGGVVIAPTDLANFCPLYRDSSSPEGITVSQFDKDDIERIGLVKFDFLGLRTLTAIQWAVDWANQRLDEDQKININTIDFEDDKVYQLLSKGWTDGIFQLESAGMRHYIKQLDPNCIEDIVAMLALYRPGPLNSGMVDQFIRRKKGQEPIEVRHPLMEPILRETYGTIVYQEQVMQIAQQLANYTLGKADDLRKAMGKKDEQLMAEQFDRFVQGAAENGISEQLAVSIYDEIKQFAEYGFNKSHSVAYALLAYQSAWLKVHHTACFYAAMMSGDMDNHSRLVELYQSALKMGLQIKGVSVNESCYQFRVIDQHSIIWALGAVKGVGEPIAQLIEEGREAGSYQTFFDFCIRAKAHKIGRRCLQTLIHAAALDCFVVGREQLLSNVEQGVELSQQQAVNQSVGQLDLFCQSSQPFKEPELVQATELIPIFEQLEKERKLAAINFGVSTYQLLLPQMQALGLLSVSQARKKIAQNKSRHKKNQLISMKVFAQVEIFRLVSNPSNRGGERFELRVTDGESYLECVIREAALIESLRFERRLSKAQQVVLYGEVSVDQYRQDLSMQVKALESYQQLRQRELKRVSLKVDVEHLASLQDILERTQANPELEQLESRQPIVADLQINTPIGWVNYAQATLNIGNELTALLMSTKAITVAWNEARQ